MVFASALPVATINVETQSKRAALRMASLCSDLETGYSKVRDSNNKPRIHGGIASRLLSSSQIDRVVRAPTYWQITAFPKPTLYQAHLSLGISHLLTRRFANAIAPHA